MGGGLESSIQTSEHCLSSLTLPVFCHDTIKCVQFQVIQQHCFWYIVTDTVRNLSRVEKKRRHCQSCAGLWMGGEVSHPWWISLWQWLDVPSSSVLLISHKTYSYMLCIQPFFPRALVPCASSKILPSCYSCSSCLPTLKGTSLPSPSFLSCWAFAVSPDVLGDL